MAIREQDRLHILERASYLCEYCQTNRKIVPVMEVDHITPISKGGTDQIDNLALVCRLCNNAKRNAVSGLDPETKTRVSLFNPRAHQWNDHFQWSSDGTQVIGITAVGRATVIRLQMNRDFVVLARANWVSAGWHPPKS